ncbi:MAG: histidine--tRNA ligase [Polyangiales bacterium]
MATLQAITGMNDVLPGDARAEGAPVERWRALEERFRSHAERHGYREVRTPLCEYAELFQRGVGEATDIVEKEMYTFEDRGGRTLSLRPEGTASAVRAALEHSVLARNPVVRWYYVGPMYRAEKPAKGRYREFFQVGVEVYGDPSPAADAEVIDLAAGFLRALGVAQFRVRLNSLGGAGSRQRYRDALVAHFTPVLAELSPESQARLARNPLRILDSKDPRDQPFKATAPRVLDHLTDDDRAHFDRVRAFLDALAVPYEVDHTMVRGLDYYTRTVFELQDASGSLGAQDSLGGGGRYDNLFRELGSPTDVPAVGFGLGIERLLMAAPAPAPRKPYRAAVVAASKDDVAVQAAALALAKELRDAGVEAHVDTRFGSLKSQMGRANEQLGAAVVLILGGSELANGTVTFRDMTREKDDPDKQRPVARAEVAAAVLAHRRATLGEPTP